MPATQDLLVFVYLGRKLPKYAVKSLKFAVEHSKLQVILISNVKKLPKLDDSLECYSYRQEIHYEQYGPYHRFRKGFWIKTTERFFALEDFMKERGIDKCFHAELDNLVFDISQVSMSLDEIGSGIFVPRDHADRAIASLMYINSLATYMDFCDFARSCNFSINDMEILAKYLKVNTNNAFALPSAPLEQEGLRLAKPEGNESSELYRLGVFDAAAIGQWYFGIDPRNTYQRVTNRFENEKYSANLSDFLLDWDELNSQMRMSSKSSAFSPTKIYNLHVHSKVHEKLLQKNRLNEIILKTNNGREVILSFNTIGKIRYVYEIMKSVYGRIFEK